MKKYLTIIKLELQRQFAYRYEIASFVPGNFFETFFTYLLWTVIYRSADTIRGYSYHEMVTYIIVGWVFSFITANYSYEENIAKDINRGVLTNYLLKPISYLRHVSVVALGRVGIAFLFVVFQSTAYIMLFGDKMIFDISVEMILILVVMALFAFFIKLFLSIFVGLLSFWFTEVSGLFSFASIVIKFLSGAFFPLIFLPAGFVKVSYFLPFIYTFFVPVQFFLGRVSRAEALTGIVIQFAWLVLLYYLLKTIWFFGLKKYESFGG